jgi:hypothetical protein
MHGDRENKRGSQKGKDPDGQHGEQLIGALPHWASHFLASQLAPSRL